ncbi:MAG: helix-turn-helix domain-containing protein [Spirochaetes bacterium]|nr:helix-turn-helix domain-containing protein [Spirochaetota bacterium]
MEERLLTVDEAAEYLGIKVKTIYNWTSKRKIRFLKCGSLVKFRLSDLEAFLDQNTIEPIASGSRR